MSQLSTDLRIALRRLLKTPVFTLAAAATLALGLGASLTLFSMIHAVLLAPLPYEDPGRLLMLRERTAVADKIPLSPAELRSLAEEDQILSGIAAVDLVGFNLAGGEAPESVAGGLVSPSFFSLLGVEPALGRFFEAGDEHTSGPRPAVISHSLWHRRFGADPEILGQPLDLYWNASFGPDREVPPSHTIVGVLPRNFRSAWGPLEIWSPLILTETQVEGDIHYLFPLGRLAPEVPLETARRDLTALLRRIGEDVRVHRGELAISAEPLPEVFIGNLRPALLSLGAAALLVLAIACINVASLLASRGFSYRRELAVRASLGASSWKLASPLLAESLVLAGLGSGLGLLLTYTALASFRRLAPESLLGTAEPRIGIAVLLAAMLLGAATVLLCGLWPALEARLAARSGTLPGITSGGSEASASMGPKRGAWVVIEVALAVLLLVGSGLLLRSFQHLSKVDPGFRSDHLLTCRISLPPQRYPDRDAQERFFKRALESLETLPGVTAAAAASSLPLVPLNFAISFSIEGRQPAQGEVFSANFRQVSSGYFDTLGITLHQGRDFNEHEVRSKPQTVIVNRALAERYWPNGDALGNRLLPNFPDSLPLEVIGVVGDVRQFGPAQPPQPTFYYPRLSGRTYNLALRTAHSPAELSGPLREAIREIDALQPVADLATMEERASLWLAPERFRSLLLTLFALLALVLATLGTYGVLDEAVTRRVRELGIRNALGARPRDLLWLILEKGLALVLAGLALGTLLALGFGRLLESFLFGIAPRDPLTFVSVLVLLFAVAALAIWIPARRASRLDPVVALKRQ